MVLAVILACSACLDERDTYVVEHVPQCMLGCQDHCLVQHVGACQSACEDTWLWTVSLDLPVCGFEWESMDAHCRGPGTQCLDLYGPALASGLGADEVCGEAVATWEACMTGSYVFDCRGQCQASCDLDELDICRAACESSWRWLDRRGHGLCLSARNQVDSQCGVERVCTHEGPIFPPEALTAQCHEALSTWDECLEEID